MHIEIRTDLDTTPIEQVVAAQEAGRLLHGKVTVLGILPRGMTSGRSSVAVVVDTGDFQVLGETSLDLFAGASRSLLASPVAAAEGHR